MKILTHMIMLLIGFLLLPVVIGIFKYNQPQNVVMKYKMPGKVLATNGTRNLLRCKKSGLTLVELNLNKKLVILCGVRKKPGKHISITVVGIPKIHI
jgi:hypothetical protein